MLYATRVSYNVDRVPPERVYEYVRRVAESAFPEADGFDHTTLHLLLPGQERRMPTGQDFCFVTVDCRKRDIT